MSAKDKLISFDFHLYIKYLTDKNELHMLLREIPSTISNLANHNYLRKFGFCYDNKI